MEERNTLSIRNAANVCVFRTRSGSHRASNLETDFSAPNMTMPSE